MDNHAIATAFGILGAVLWSLQLFPQIWKNWRRHSSESLSPLFFLAWAIAGIPLGVYNIVDDLNIALQIQPNILLLLSLITWSQCKHYGDGWSWTKTSIVSLLLAVIFGGIETGLVFALRLGRDRGLEWPSTLMAIVAAVLLAGGVLRHYVDMIKTRSDAGMSLKFALLDASGDLASLISVVFQPHLKILGLVIYGSELAIWIGLICLVCCFRISHRTKSKDPGPILEDV
ncbi:PQ loop repeat protein-like protein [Aureobasidium pullulans]|uniref:PQ loop repeat protein-like protein n=1 Tax=Aureobasidium pullulans TaxID=5580 RepID=A0A4S9HZN8_AURPU|nr:PQ loop repeat protein-like protein [Aureobasidium pullulans]THX81601.1 PQ loop repeat protein-like protein [Aureobasidium pullulans]TIA52787.1 PQ loop repeat protein-like protein [Aureobasidium pullulans]TIA66562.1 PQ loop repeat protein-like protein [Aureobasidium pullulans]